MQFMRDMCMRRDNIVERIQWDDEIRDRIRSIALKLAYVTRTSLQHEDVENRMFEMRSPSGRYVITFRYGHELCRTKYAPRSKIDVFRLQNESLRSFVSAHSASREINYTCVCSMLSHLPWHFCRCNNSAEADAWFESIHGCACALLTQALAQVNLMLGQSPQVRRMGWVAEQVSILRISKLFRN